MTAHNRVHGPREEFYMHTTTTVQQCDAPAAHTAVSKNGHLRRRLLMLAYGGCAHRSISTADNPR